MGGFLGEITSSLTNIYTKNNNGNIKKNILFPNGFKKNIYSLLIATLAINILSLSLPIMTLQVYDRILPNPGTGTLPILIMGVCCALVLEVILRLLRAYVTGRSGAAYEHRMGCQAMNKILNSDLSKIERYGIGEYLHRMASIGKLKDFYNGYSLTVFTDLIFVPLFFGLIFYIGGALALVPLSIISIFVMIALWRGHRLRKSLKARDDADDKRFNFLIESLEGIHTIKAFAVENFFTRRYETMEEQSCLENYKVTQETAKTFNVSAVFSHIMVASVISFGAWGVLSGLLTNGSLIAILLLSGRMMQPIQKALALWARYQDYSLSRDHIIEILQTPQKNFEIQTNDIPRLPDGKLILENVSFQYKNSDQPILNNINLKINRGDCILISGDHGVGKSTLLNVIAGIYPPKDGLIKIDNDNIQTYSSQDLVRHIGYIQTSSLIFRGTIRDNITCFGQVNEDKAKEIAGLLNVDKDVAKLPAGFDTFLNGNNTDSIPPGLKQRIAITRVLATKPRIILFDNADRSLDLNGYTMIHSLLAKLKGKASMILISGDENIRALFDRHYVLRDGKLIELSNENNEKNIHPYKELKL